LIGYIKSSKIEKADKKKPYQRKHAEAEQARWTIAEKARSS